ncbi:MAG: HGGxSTG domain-containing protein [Allosphingosinicella sp.]
MTNNPMEPAPLRNAPRCRARTRRGTECRSPGMPNGRCRLHGGKSPGAPKGNKNAWKHGLRSAAWLAQRAEARMLAAALRGFP